MLENHRGFGRKKRRDREGEVKIGQICVGDDDGEKQTERRGSIEDVQGTGKHDRTGVSIPEGSDVFRGGDVFEKAVANYGVTDGDDAKFVGVFVGRKRSAKKAEREWRKPARPKRKTNAKHYDEADISNV